MDQARERSVAYEAALLNRGEQDALVGHQPLMPDSLSYMQGYVKGLQKLIKDSGISRDQNLRSDENDLDF